MVRTPPAGYPGQVQLYHNGTSRFEPAAAVQARGAGESVKPGAQAPGLKARVYERARDSGRQLSPASRARMIY